jgi:hypothetical protein
LVVLLKRAEEVKPRLLVRSGSTLVGGCHAHSYRAGALRPKAIKQQIQGTRSYAPTHELGLSDQNVHVNVIHRQVGKPSRREFVGSRFLPTQVSHGPAIDSNNGVVRCCVSVDES